MFISINFRTVLTIRYCPKIFVSVDENNFINQNINNLLNKGLTKRYNNFSFSLLE